MCRRLFAILPLASLLLFGAPQKRKQAAATLDLSSFQARRSGDRVEIDGKLKNTGQEPVSRGELVFSFLSTDKRVLSTRRADLEPELLKPGEETVILLQTPYPAGAVSILVGVSSKDGRAVNLDHRGPYPIE